MRRIVVSILALLVTGSIARAAEPLRIDGDALAPQGDLNVSPLDVEGGSSVSIHTILQVDNPRVSGDSYAVSGRVEYKGVVGDGYLEMWSYFPDGSHYFSRTFDVSGPMAKLSGTSPPRPFILPCFLSGSPARPNRLVINVVLPGAGSVRVSDLRFGPAGVMGSAPGAWWSSREGGWIGGVVGSVVGVLGALVGALCAWGRGRRLALGTLVVMGAYGGLCAIAGAAALVLGQGYEVWYPLLLSGVLAAALGIGLCRVVQQRFNEHAAARHVELSARPPGAGESLNPTGSILRRIRLR